EGVSLADAHPRVGAREDSQLDDLRPDERHRDEPEHGVDLPGPTEDVDGARREDDHTGEPEQEQEAARAEVQPTRAVQEHEADVAPRVAEAVQLRLSDPRVVVDRDLADGEVTSIGLEHHLGGELHPGRVEVEYLHGVTSYRAHPAVRVRDLHPKE